MTVLEKGLVGSFSVYSNYNKNGANPGEYTISDFTLKLSNDILRFTGFTGFPRC